MRTTTPQDYLDALLSLPWLWAPKVSRDGKWIAWSWFHVGPAADVFVVPTDGSANPLRLTETSDNTMMTSWTPDGRSVIVQQDEGGNERAQLFRIDLDEPRVMQPLTEPSPKYFVRGGQLHPNRRWLVYAANLDAQSGQAIEPTWVYRHDLESGERRALARPAEPAYYAPQLNDQGSHILYARHDQNPAGRQIWMVDIEGHEDREVLNAGPDNKVYASWFPDGVRVLLLTEEKVQRRLGIWHRETDTVRWLIDSPERNVEHAFVPHGSSQAVAIEVRDARTYASLIDPETGAETRLSDVDQGNLIPLAPAGSGWVGRYFSAQQPDDLVRFSVEDPQPASFTSLTGVWDRTPLEPDDLTPAEDLRWVADDGQEIQGWLYRADGRPKGTIVHVHGGPTSHSQDRINTEVQFFVAEGFNVLDPNYRGSTGFGLAFQEAIKDDGWGGREQDDIRAGIQALIAADIAEPRRVGITGTSYGGYSAWCAITRWPPDVLKAAVPICGMTDLILDYETTRPDLRPYSEEMMGGSPAEVPDRYYERSPINFVDRIQGRVLVAQGERDPNVTPDNVRSVVERLEAAGVPYELLVFEDEGHGILRPVNRKTLYMRMAAFFAAAFADA